MIAADLLPNIYVAAGAAGAAFFAYFVLFRGSPVTAQDTKGQSPDNRPIYLFDDDYLLDASPEGYRLIEDREEGQSERTALLALLERQFPDIHQTLSQLETASHVRLLALNDPGTYLDIDDVDGLLRIALNANGDVSAVQHFDAALRAAQLQENAHLKETTRNAPQLIWREDIDGVLVWANKAYLDFADQVRPETEMAASVWPKDLIFPDLDKPDDPDAAPLSVRKSVVDPETEAERWFDITSVRVEDGILRYAADASAAVRAEQARRAFLQTLAKTFADLSVGLATFDSKRRLTIFNPAIHDITGLPIDFLSSRPSLEMVLDRLREMRKVPEPKDYNSWREQFLALEAEAVRGTYCQLWDLPDGQIVRVTGRPHPDGGIALLFEDISAEISLTRRFRSEIETGQAVLDTLPEAIAVFSRANTMVMINKAYQDLWRADASGVALDYDLRAAMRVWKAGCAPSNVWRQIENFANATGEREEITEKVILNDGRTAACHAVPVSGGVTLVKFSLTSKRKATLQKITTRDPALHAVKG